jgi:hypothetical protein
LGYLTSNCVQISAVSYLINIYGSTFGASASAANSLARYGFAAAFPLFAVQSEQHCTMSKNF